MASREKNYTSLRIVLERLSCWGQFVTCNSEMFEILSQFFSFGGILSIYRPQSPRYEQLEQQIRLVCELLVLLLAALYLCKVLRINLKIFNI